MKSKKRKSNGGFTLVELLATLAVLSLVVSIVTYSAVGIVNNAKRKSYETTINNIKVAAKNYALEQVDTSSKWTKMVEKTNCISGETCQYQCVTIQKLIDTGYFSADVLDSYKSEGETGRVKLEDMIYVQRDFDTKTITHQDLYYTEFCSINTDVEEKEPSGKVEIVVDYKNGVADVKIYYDLSYVSDNYKYKLEYDFDKDNESKKEFYSSSGQEKRTMQLYTNGTVTARILREDGQQIAIATHSISLDNTPPVVTLNSTNEVKVAQTLTITMSDSETGISSYSITGPGVDESGVDVPTDGIKITISESGTYTVSAKDGVDNNTTKTIKYVKTDFVVDGGTPTPNYMITVANEPIEELPSLKKSSFLCEYIDSSNPLYNVFDCKNYFSQYFYVTLTVGNDMFDGWYTTKSYWSKYKVKLPYIPKEDAKLYGQGLGDNESTPKPEESTPEPEPTPESKPTCTVTYIANGGSGTMSTYSFECGGNHKVQPNGFTRDGWKFVRWNIKPDGTGDGYTSGYEIKNITSDLILYAIWAEDCVNTIPSGYTLINNLQGLYCKSFTMNPTDVGSPWRTIINGTTCEFYAEETSGIDDYYGLEDAKKAGYSCGSTAIKGCGGISFLKNSSCIKCTMKALKKCGY